eukprot:414327_1
MEYLQDVIREHDLSSFLRGGLRTNPYLVFASSGDGQSSLQQKTEKKQYSIKRAKEILIEQELKKYLSVENIGARRLVTVIEATQSCYRWWEQDCSTATIGGDHDAFGYSTSYGWCSATNKCCRPWEDTCSSIGSDKDEHVCILSAGYSYCVSPATASTPPIPPTTPPT